jgi:autotransporter-associated beta strand protein
MNGPSSFLASLVITATAAAPALAATATVTWDGGPSATGTDLGVAANWSSDVLPSPAGPDIAQWNGTVAGALSLVYSDASLAGVAGNAGLTLELTTAQTGAVNLDSGVNTSALRINNITIGTDAGALTLGNSADTFNLTLGGAASTQTFTNNSTNAATISSDAILSLGGGGNHVLNFTGSGNWSVASNLAFASGGNGTIYKTGTGTLTLSGGGALKEGATVLGNAGASATFKEGATIINGGTYTNNITTNNGELVVGGLDTVGTNTSLTVNNASVLNGIDWLSVGKGNGTGATTNNLTLNNTASISAVNMSLGWNNNSTSTPAGTVTLNDSATLTVNTTAYISESAGANFALKLNGTSTATLSNTVNIASGANSTALVEVNAASTATFANAVNIAGGTNSTAVVEVNGTSLLKQTANSNQTRLGLADGSTGTLKINGGTATFERDLVFGYAGTGTGRLTLDSGTLNVANGTKRWLKVNDTVGSKGELTINGGNINLNTNTDLRFSTNANAAGTSFVTLNGGTISGFTGNNNGTLSGASVVDLNQASTTATINNSFNLNGGTLAIGQVITSNDTGTATFNFNGGTLKAAANSNNFLDLGGANQTAKVLAGGAKIDTNGKDVTIPQALLTGVTGDGGLTKLGTGSLKLTGACTYTGATTVSAGTLTVPTVPFFTWGSGINVNGTGAKLASSGTITVPVTLTAGSIDAVGDIDNLTVANSATNTINPGNGGNGQLKSVNLTFQGAATINVQATGTTMDRNLNVTNSLTTNAAGVITVNATNTTGVWTSGQDYPVIEYGVTFTGSTSHFAVGTIPGLNPNQTAQIVNTGSAIAIRITGESLVWTGTQSADWSTNAIGGSKNWSYLGNGIEFSANSPVIFDDTASRFNVNLATNVNPSTVLFANNFDYTLSSTGGFGITSGTLSKTGTGRLTIGTNNTYTGATQLNEGVVEVTGTIGSSSTITVAANAELILNSASATTYGNVLAGSGIIRKQGTAALTLAGASTFSGNFLLENGTLNLNSAGALGAGPGYIEITGGVLDNTSGAAVTMTGAKPQRWNTDITFTGTNDLAMGTGAVTVGGTGPRTVNVVAGNFGSGGITTGTAQDLVKTGAGSLRLSGSASTIHGTLDIQSGIVGMGEDLFADGLAGTGILENNTANTKWSFWNIVTDQTAGTLIRDGAGAGRLGIVKRGTATWTLTNNSNFATGNLSAENGKLVLNNTGTYGVFPGGPVITNLTSVVGSTAAANGVLEINGATVNYNTMNGADGAAFRASLTIGTNGTGAGALRLNSGSLTTYRQLAAGGANGAYGAFTQTGGTTNVGGFLALGLGTGTGVFTQTGGIYNQTTSPITNGAGAGSNGVIRLTGSAVFNVNGTLDNGIWLGENGTGRLSVSGNAALNFATGNNGLQLGRNAAGVGVANLLGGNVTTFAVTKGAGTGTLSFNGGTLTANAPNAAFLTGLTNTYVHANGGTIANGGNAITVGQALLAPTGNGVSATGLTVSGSGFIAAPLVQITGDGTGATAVAEVDTNGNLTGITITNPGIGYTTAPAFTLVGGGIGNTGSIGGTATLVPNVSGGMTFTGNASTILSGQSTYTGNTVVTGGTTVGVSSTGGLTFKPGANHVSNKVTGAGSASFDGSFTLDLTGATVANGNTWTLVDVASKTYSGVSFTIPGFTEASDVWTKVDGNNTWTYSESTGVLSLAVSSGGGFSSWIGGFGLAPADQDATDDPDGDGIANFLEYALGGDPSLREPSLVPTGSKSGSNFVLSFSRSDLAMTNGDAPLAIEYGTTLGSWTTVAVPASSGTVSGVTFNVAGGSPNDAITATIPTGGSGKFFARVKAGN